MSEGGEREGPGALPAWQPGAPAVLCVAGGHAIPVSTIRRAGPLRLVFALGRRRETLRRLREDPRASVCLLAEGVAFTAYGRASVLSEELEGVPVCGVELAVDRVQDHLADGRTEMLAGAGWRWADPRAAEADEKVRAGLARLAAPGPEGGSARGEAG